jgi:hypothetical protein
MFNTMLITNHHQPKEHIRMISTILANSAFTDNDKVVAHNAKQ